ncbi:MAG: tyrosine-type recombinase/integrase [Pseudomonadota bacterium]|nr:tyrosine-type recombinase/integrase [Pseudomonadota bacterium]
MRISVKHVHRVRDRFGTARYYHRITRERLDKDANGRTRSIEEILERANQINAGLNKGRKVRSAHGTVGHLITLYRESPDYLRLAQRTRDDYARVLDNLVDRIGGDLVRDVTTEDVLELQQALVAKPRTADAYTGMVRRLLNFALPRRRTFGITVNVADAKAGVVNINKAEPYKPWPEPLIETVIKAAPVEVGLAIALAVTTGQRAEQLVSVRWSDVDDEGVAFRPLKRGDPVWVPIYPELKDVIDALPKRAVMLLTTKTGRPWRADSLGKAVGKALTDVGVEGYVLHGLRKNAVARLLEAGCSDAEVQAITGHKTRQMIEHYGKDSNRRRIARAAVANLVNRTKLD